jgi:hypothetical protein
MDYQPTSLPFLATYHCRFQLDPVRVLPRQLLQFETLTFLPFGPV